MVVLALESFILPFFGEGPLRYSSCASAPTEDRFAFGDIFDQWLRGDELCIFQQLIFVHEKG